MKLLFSLLLCTGYFFSIAQQSNSADSASSMDDNKSTAVTGYMNNTKLSHLHSRYVVLALRFRINGDIKEYTCDYGQPDAWHGNGMIKDNTGHEISFKNRGQALNFFDYNGYELLQVSSETQNALYPLYLYFKRKE